MSEPTSPAAHAAHDIEATAENLREELVRLGIQKQALERELAAVAAHLGSVRQTLDALRDLVPATPSPPSRGTAAEPAPGRQPAGAPAAAADRAEAHARRTYGRLTEQIMEYFAGAGTADLRARDVAAALGRDSDSGSINAVRSTLDRLVGAARLRRTGRGLYRANPS
ncbi:hypothetical protein [Actinacidiphila rubida]|uniref:Uncharacterized protein n=1 Tax=Actinacidiphila rubida TaxID=310780 RepID=A0A1H8K9B5_9ACTN|nr:hypothetical protein [Actinacidiphila rubida]SEN89291.1 hypothetical protein SAMN05216267_101257 [Actinacidiphila rubida]